MKTCRDCRRELPRSEFYRHGSTVAGLRGRCKACHIRDTVARAKRKRGPLPTREERFDAKVSPGPDGCWVWAGARSAAGYGMFQNGRVTGAGHRVPDYAHRVAFERHVGLIPADRELDHLCRNRACVNPEHLEAVTHRTNLIRGHRWRNPE